MKNLNRAVIASFSVLLMTFIACNNSKGAQSQEVDLKKDDELKENVFEQILNDEELFTDFTSKMRENRQAMEWMRENRPMMQGFYSGNQMRDMMRRNPEMRPQMMQNMMEMMGNDSVMMRPNPEMRRQMMQNMMRMMEQDTVMQNRMREMMQKNGMN